MMNDEIKTKALAEYEKAVKDYTSVFETLKAEYERLNLTRKQTVDLIAHIEDFINSLANTPKEFETTIGHINIERANFPRTEDLASKAQKAVFESAYKIIAGFIIVPIKFKRLKIVNSIFIMLMRFEYHRITKSDCLNNVAFPRGVCPVDCNSF